MNTVHALTLSTTLSTQPVQSLERPANSARTLTFGEALGLALQNDPIYLSAQANADVSHARATQASARLLPQINASANTNDNRRETVLGNATNSIPERYNSHGVQVSLTQPLLDADKYFARSQADLLAQQANYQLQAAKGELLIRLMQVWLDIGQAQDVVTATDSAVAVSQQELGLAQHAVDKGVMPMTAREMAQTRHAQALSEQVAAQTEHSLKLALLEQIIGTSDRPVMSELLQPPLSSNLQQQGLAHWLMQANNTNSAIQAAQLALEAANEAVRQQRSGHLPTLALVASHNQSTQGSGITGGQNGFRSRTNSIGLQFNLPIFSGGEQSAKVAEAIAQRDRARYALAAAERETQLKIKQAWLRWQASDARRQFGKQASQSAITLLKSAEAQRARGIKSGIDVLKAQQQRDEVQRDWNQARNDAMLNYLMLKAESGTLSVDDLLTITHSANTIYSNQQANKTGSNITVTSNGYQ